MFRFLDLFGKRVNDQIAEYAAAQSDIVRRAWGDLFDPFRLLRPARIIVHRRPHRRTSRHDAASRRPL